MIVLAYIAAHLTHVHPLMAVAHWTLDKVGGTLIGIAVGWALKHRAADGEPTKIGNRRAWKEEATKHGRVFVWDAVE